MKYYRRLPEFEYLAPRSIEEACSLLQKHKGEARVTAGGTIVISRMKERIGVRKYLVSLKAIPDLDYITFGESVGLTIGAMARLQSIADSPIVRERFKTLAMVCAGLGTPQIRNMGTIGGNVCSRFPSAETVPILLALGAEAKIASTDREKTVAVQDLYKELKETQLVTEIRVPTLPPGTRGAHQRFTIRAGMDYATVSVAVVLTSANGVCQDIKIAFGGEDLSPMRAKEAEGMVRGQVLRDSLIAKASQAASEEVQAVSDIYLSAEYKKELVKVLVGRAIKEAGRK